MTTSKDICDTSYTAPSNGPATAGTHVTVHTSSGPVSGVFTGTHAIPNKN